MFSVIPIIYTDGCCLRNGRTDAVAGIGVYWGNNDIRNRSLPIDGVKTNGRAELLAVIRAIEQAISLDIECIKIRTDSSYVVLAFASFDRWMKRDWKSANYMPLLNVDLLKQCVVLRDRIKVIISIDLKHFFLYLGDRRTHASREQCYC